MDKPFEIKIGDFVISNSGSRHLVRLAGHRTLISAHWDRDDAIMAASYYAELLEWVRRVSADAAEDEIDPEIIAVLKK